MKKSAALLASAIIASASSPLAFSDIYVGPGDVHTVPFPSQTENNVTVEGGTIDGTGVLDVVNSLTATSGTISNFELNVLGTMEKNSSGTLYLPERLVVVNNRAQINNGSIEASNMTLLDARLAIASQASASFSISSGILTVPTIDAIVDGHLSFIGSGSMNRAGRLYLEGGSGSVYLADFSSYHGVEIFSSDPGSFTGTIELNNSRAGRNVGSTPGVFQNADVILNNNSRLYVRSEAVGSLAGDDTSTFRIRGRVEVGGNGTDTEFDGYIDRSGPYAHLVKVGDGTMVFGGETDYLSRTTIAGGAFLMKDGSEIRSDVFVLPAEPGFHAPLFGGEGYVRGDLISDGRVLAGMPGSAGTLTVRDNYVQGPEGTFIVQFDSHGNNSRMVVGGDAYLDGGIRFIAGKPSYVPRNTEIAVLNTEWGEVYGEFTSAKAFGRLIPHITYEDCEVLVSFTARKFTSYSCLTPNGKEIARQLDRMDRDSGGSGRKLIDKIDDATWGKEGVVCDLINHYLSPEQLTSIFRAGFAAGQIQAGNIERHLEFAREDAGYLYEGRTLNLSGKYGSIETNGGPINRGDGLSLAGWDGKTVVDKQVVAPPVVVPAKWNFFITGTGEWGDIENTRDTLGTDLTTGGVTVGADYRVSDNFLVGLLGGYNHTTSDLWDDGRLRVNGGRGGAYASLFNENAFLNLLATGGYDSYDIRRSSFGGEARGKSHGGEFNGLISGGYEFDCGGWRIGPIGGVQYTYIQLDSFKEDGSDAPLHFPKQSQNSLRSTLGARVAYDWEFCGVKVTPEVRAQWLHEYLDATASIDSQFAAGGDVFTTYGSKIGRNGLLLDAGLSVQVTPHCALYAYYTGDLARENYTAHAVNGGLRVQF